jgi:hypothetical protein
MSRNRGPHPAWWAYQLRLALERAEECRSELRARMGREAEPVIARIEEEVVRHVQ